MLVLFAAENYVGNGTDDAKRNDEAVPANLKLAKQRKNNFVQFHFLNAKTGERNKGFIEHTFSFPSASPYSGRTTDIAKYWGW